MDELVVAYTGNLSRGGLRLRTEASPEPGKTVELRIELPDGLPEMQVPCTVVFVNPPARTGGKYDVGVKFIDPDQETKRRLEWYIVNSDPEPGQFGNRPYARRLDVLLVEDDPLQQQAIAEPFRARGDDVRLAADGLEGLSQCLQKTPDVVLSDVQMPKLDGWQLLRMIRARASLKHVPVLFLTTLQGEADRLLGYRLGVDDYLPKPHRPEELLARTDRAVARAGQLATSSFAEGLSALRGDLEQVSFTSVVAFLEMEQKSGILRVGPETNAFVAFRDGHPVAISVVGAPLDRSPEQLFFELLDLSEGRFEFTSRDVDDVDVFMTTVTALLLEHARREDEADR